MPLLADAPSLPVPWRVGEHVFVAGDTDCGKTFLVARLIQLRKHVLFVRTKLQDDTEVGGLLRVDSASAMRDMYATRLLLQPPLRRQRAEVLRALETVFRQGGWTVVVDELFYVEQKLHLRDPVEVLLTQGRSHKITVVTETQRPSRITRFALAESKHLFLFMHEGRDVLTLKEATTPRIVEAIESLRGFRFAYYGRRNRIVATGNARQLSQIIRFPSTSQPGTGQPPPEGSSGPAAPSSGV